ncbi:MAG TPA: alpha/beta hydrolase [Thermoanaerobaculia bacterium]
MVHRYVMQRVEDEDLRMFVVWGPMLDKETEEDAKKATATVPDPRATHFWTDSDRVAELFQEVLGFEDPEEQGWDTFTVYRPGVEWREGPPPEPDRYMHFGKPLPEERQLDGVLLAEEIRALLGGGGGGEGGGTGPAAASLELEPCELPGFQGAARCGTLPVWEDPEAGEGREIGLRVAVLPATGPDGAAGPAKAPPLFALSGGPGESAVLGAGHFARVFAEARKTRDLVLVDQRGTGASNPLRCPFPGDDEDPQSYLGDQLPAAAFEACLETLDADPRLYTTPIAADDLDRVRAALGHERIDLYGFSYGTRVALVYLRRHPERVRSAILAGAVPTDMAVPTHHAPDAQRAMDLLFEECAADAECAAAYPDLKEKFWTVWRRLGEAPVAVDLVDPKTGEEARVTLTRDLFAEEMRWRLYDAEANFIPPLVERAHQGDFRDIAALLLRLRRVIGASQALATGMFMSVTCAEDVPFIDPAEARRLAEGTFLGTYRVEQQREACAVWPRGEVPEGWTEPVRAEAPVLILSGYRDPVTPPQWGESVAAHLPKARHVVLRHGFHAGIGGCEGRLMNRFVIEGTAAGLDVSCAERAPEAPWLMPDEEIPVE